MRFPDHLLDDIRARLPLSEVVGRRVTWDRRKSQASRGDFWACCPFHQEKSPSFHVDDRKGFYHCFGCGASGDHIRFVMETEGASFPEAVERLAGEAGVPLPAKDPESARREARRQGLGEVVEIAAQFFEATLRTPTGREARAYSERRGLSAETMRSFRVGYAPAERDALKRHLQAKGVDEPLMIEAGLLIRPDDGRPAYDRFRNRLIIPIHDGRGRVVAFGGRALGADQDPKYLNSPETPLFQKRALLFNAHRARDAARASGSIVVVEGYLDAIAVWQAGIKGVVATLGTAFTEDQILALWRLAPEPVVCFDGDRAGIAAAHRAVDRILPLVEAGRSFNFAFLPDGKDPDELIATGGPDRFLAEVGAAAPLFEVLLERETENAKLDTPERRAAVEKRLEDLVGQIRDAKVAKRYRLSLRLKLSEIFWKSERINRQKEALGNQISDTSSTKIREKILLGLSVEKPDVFIDLHEDIVALDFGDERLQSFVNSLIWVLEDTIEISTSYIYNQLSADFFHILNDIHGKIKIIEGEEERVIWGFQLKRRVPILKFHPPEEYVRELFEWVIAEMQMKQEEAELSVIAEGISDTDCDIESEFKKLVERKYRIEDQKKTLEDASRKLADWNKEIMKNYGRGSASGGFPSISPAMTA